MVFFRDSISLKFEKNIDNGVQLSRLSRFHLPGALCTQEGVRRFRMDGEAARVRRHTIRRHGKLSRLGRRPVLCWSWHPAVLRPLTLYHFRDQGAPRPRAFDWMVHRLCRIQPHMDNGNIKAAIDLSLDRAALLLSKGTKVYKRIIYSCSEDDRSLIGTGVFKKTLGQDVVDYISKGIAELPTRHHVQILQGNSN